MNVIAVPGDPATPTRKGLCFSRALIPELVALLEQAQEAGDNE